MTRPPIKLYYDATNAVFEAMRKADSTDPAKFTPELLNISGGRIKSVTTIRDGAAQTLADWGAALGHENNAVPLCTNYVSYSSL